MEEVKKQAEAEKWAPFGEKAKPKENWEEIEGELQEVIKS